MKKIIISGRILFVLLAMVFVLPEHSYAADPAFDIFKGHVDPPESCFSDRVRDAAIC